MDRELLRRRDREGLTASTAFTNPAGMVRLNQNEIRRLYERDLSVRRPSAGRTSSAHQTTPGLQGGNSFSRPRPARPSRCGTYPADRSLASPIDLALRTQGYQPGRFRRTVSEPRFQRHRLNFTISAAYRINEHFSMGGGPVIDYFKSRLTQAINIGVNQLVGDPVADLHGDDVGCGFNVGGLYQFNDDTAGRARSTAPGSPIPSTAAIRLRAPAFSAASPGDRGPAGFR